MNKFMLSVLYISKGRVDFVGTKEDLLQDISERMELNRSEKNVMSWTITPLY